MISHPVAPLWGIDLGGTKIEGVILDPEFPKESLHRLRVPTESAYGYDHILTQIASLVAHLEDVSGFSRASSIGIGTPGITIPSSGLLKNSNTLCLNGRPLAKDLERILGCSVVLANDANCCALAEAKLGAARGQKTVFGIILGTGVGGGIVVNGEVLSGKHGICGEWGHNPSRVKSLHATAVAGGVWKPSAADRLSRVFTTPSGEIPFPSGRSRCAPIRERRKLSQQLQGFG